MVAYVNAYSYCFYPNSEKAEFIGYFRYDFHPDGMGEGDLGEHSYFHAHHRQVENSFRMPTGVIIDFDKIVSAIESILAPSNREKRLGQLLASGKFEALLMDLTIDGVKRRIDTLKKNTSMWKQYEHKEQCAQFLKDY